jgi:hypothetical protein
MSPIPTESRIFGDRYFRNVRRLEKLHAGRIAPGTATWTDALKALLARMRHANSPVKQAAILGKAIDYLNGVAPEDLAHIMFTCSQDSRSAGVCFATFSAGLHPFKNVDEEGLSILQHVIYCDRRCRSNLIAGYDLAYVSLHAMRRLHERDYDLTAVQATSIFAFMGILGFLTRGSDKHVRGQVNLHFGDVLVTGSLKHGRKPMSDGSEANGTLYEVRTVLPADEVANRDMLEQGRIAAHVVATWREGDCDPQQVVALAGQIPFLPREDDYTLRAVTRQCTSP